MTLLEPMLALRPLWAEAAKPPRKLDPINDIGLPLAALAGALLVLAIAVLIMKRWYLSNRADDDDDSSLLTGLRDAADDGDLTPEELKIIKSKLAGGLGKNGRVDPAVTPRPNPRPSKPASGDDE
jgi:hypothetical protein